MKKTVLFLNLIILFFMSCNTSKKTAEMVNSLEGTWELNYISGPRIAFKGLYPNQVPNIVFNLKSNQFYGTNSCNRYSGELNTNRNKINFKDSKIETTLMACEGNGDTVFMSTLDKIDSYSISDDGKTLNFIMGDIAMMRFERVGSK